MIRRRSKPGASAAPITAELVAEQLGSVAITFALLSIVDENALRIARGGVDGAMEIAQRTIE